MAQGAPAADRRVPGGVTRIEFIDMHGQRPQGPCIKECMRSSCSIANASRAFLRPSASVGAANSVDVSGFAVAAVIA